MTQQIFNEHSSIILIGMAGAGKSTLGPLLARRLGWEHLDTDRLIESYYGARLQDILDVHGPEGLMACEEEVVSNISVVHCVVSTGGSVVYSERIMDRLRLLGPIINLYVDLDTCRLRVGPAKNRGFVMPRGLDFEDVYAERRPLYELAADLSVDTCTLSPDQSVDTIMEWLNA